MKNWIVASLIFAALPAIAYNRGYNSPIASSFVEARVIDVRPNIVQECYSVQEHRPSYGGGYEQPPRSRTAPVLGAIVGGALGNQIGGGSGRDAATVAGAALGYSITRDAQERNRYNNSQYDRGGYSQRRQCDERVEGYNVTFIIDGRRHSTYMQYNPGHTIRLRVDYSLQ